MGNNSFQIFLGVKGTGCFKAGLLTSFFQKEGGLSNRLNAIGANHAFSSSRTTGVPPFFRQSRYPSRIASHAFFVLGRRYASSKSSIPQTSRPNLSRQVPKLFTCKSPTASTEGAEASSLQCFG